MITTSKVQPTQNQRGFTYLLPPIGEQFVHFASTCEHSVVDIGAAYGVATLPALEAGARVIAVDISEQHLVALKQRAARYQSSLRIIPGRFPFLYDRCLEGIGAAYLSQVLPFLTPDQVMLGANRLYNWLVPGGKVFIVSFTPFLNHVHRFLDVYHERKAQGKRFAGYIDTLAQYCSDKTIGDQLPESILHVDEDDLRSAFSEAGFAIEHLSLFGDVHNDLPEGIRYDGRERVGMIASKPN